MKKLLQTNTTMMGLCLLIFFSCQNWGAWDDPSGNQKNPVPPDASVKAVAYFPFDTDLTAVDAAIICETIVPEGGSAPEITDDVERGNVLHQNGGYVRFTNPLQGLNVAQGASVAMWVKMPEVDIAGALFSFLDDDGNLLYFTGNAFLTYKGTGGGWFEVNRPETILTGDLQPNQWHFIAVTLTYSGYIIYIDGEKKYETANPVNFNSGDAEGVSNNAFDFKNMVTLLTTAPYIYLGYGAPEKTKEVYFDDVKIYKNQISATEAQPVISLPEPAYLNTFDAYHTAEIKGGGSFVPSGNDAFGVIFQNVTGGMRENYLLLPDNILSHSVETKAITIGVWVNSLHAGASADYMWAPLFTAYGSAPAADNTNTWPMLALQYRGVVQVNCSGWCDFTATQNDLGVNTLYHNTNDWLVDHQWHYYTATFTETTAKVYFDGILVNSWTVSGSGGGNEIKGLFSNGVDLKYNCLGGNQAWNWGDQDPGFMFDDFVIYNVELTAEQIALIIANKYAGN
ncbi:MAG: LamG domain-containing protein [Dysgonamonadaceae bacterium]|jgi:hypothetical protein|nr:LamG domain-containing protein [Dysgonamonadaceae bacterium]